MLGKSKTAFAAALLGVAMLAPAAHAQSARQTTTESLTQRQTSESAIARRHLRDQTAVQTNISVRQPRFLINAVRIYAVNETGRDWAGSDEPYAVFWDTRSGDRLFTTPFGGVDTGDTRNFPVNQSCMFPVGARQDIRNGFPTYWWCDPAGRAGGVNVRVELREDDTGQLYACGRAADLPAEPVSCQYNTIGRTTISYTESALVGLLPNIGDTREFDVPIGGYTFRYRVQRVADVVVRQETGSFSQ